MKVVSTKMLEEDNDDGDPNLFEDEPAITND
jgi:hypothetical protein